MRSSCPQFVLKAAEGGRGGFRKCNKAEDCKTLYNAVLGEAPGEYHPQRRVTLLVARPAELFHISQSVLTFAPCRQHPLSTP
ncbi:hypothetical protein V8E36_001995 [Tilletia maclaganii]